MPNEYKKKSYKNNVVKLSRRDRNRLERVPAPKELAKHFEKRAKSLRAASKQRSKARQASRKTVLSSLLDTFSSYSSSLFAKGKVSKRAEAEAQFLEGAARGLLSHKRQKKIRKAAFHADKVKL